MEIDIKPNCHVCKTELSKAHIAILMNAFHNRKMLGDYVRKIDGSDYTCENCFELNQSISTLIKS